MSIINNILETNITSGTPRTSYPTTITGDSFSSIFNAAINNNQTATLDQIFERAAATYNVPVNLLKAVARVESSFNPKAQSGCGAQGIMQLMPGTAKELGVTNAFDPEQNIMGGAKYLSKLLKRFDNNVENALAAYNAGPGNVAKYNGVPPRAQGYVDKVMKFYSSYNASGITLNDPINVSGSVDYGSLASNASSGKTDSSLAVQLLLYMQWMVMASDYSQAFDTSSSQTTL